MAYILAFCCAYDVIKVNDSSNNLQSTYVNKGDRTVLREGSLSHQGLLFFEGSILNGVTFAQIVNFAQIVSFIRVIVLH